MTRPGFDTTIYQSQVDTTRPLRWSGVVVFCSIHTSQDTKMSRFYIVFFANMQLNLPIKTIVPSMLSLVKDILPDIKGVLCH